MLQGMKRVLLSESEYRKSSGREANACMWWKSMGRALQPFQYVFVWEKGQLQHGSLQVYLLPSTPTDIQIAKKVKFPDRRSSTTT